MGEGEEEAGEGEEGEGRIGVQILMVVSAEQVANCLCIRLPGGPGSGSGRQHTRFPSVPVLDGRKKKWTPTLYLAR